MFGFNCFEFILPVLGKVFLAFSVSLMLVVFITLFAAGKALQSAANVLINYTTSSGWPDTVAFFIVINSMNWCFSCLNASTHLVEEIPKLRKNIPKALVWTVIVGLFTSIMMILAIFFNVVDVERNNTIMLIFYSTLNENKAGPSPYVH
ncbi:hypothetical protein B0T10DRAFT_567830 [Thelonectria olida]|uniref:Uncharacterized protein n=1 Tax=Thelonectria olida TaxID=1576542 RepID=A0A9P8VSF2_9HYPO|nr:hypothetical protein B0T10DRAFT_567830 [Thelonectria olida]